MKTDLTWKEASAIEELIGICDRIGLFEEQEDGDPDFVYTTGKTLDLESLEKEDWELLKELVKKDYGRF